MAGIVEKIKNFFSGKLVCKLKRKEKTIPQEEEPKKEESKEGESSPF